MSFEKIGSVESQDANMNKLEDQLRQLEAGSGERLQRAFRGYSGTPEAVRSLHAQAKKWREMSSEEFRTPEQRSDFKNGADIYETLGADHQKIVDMRIAMLPANQRETYIAEHDRYDRTIAEYERQLLTFAGSSKERQEMVQGLRRYEGYRSGLELWLHFPRTDEERDKILKEISAAEKSEIAFTG